MLRGREEARSHDCERGTQECARRGQVVHLHLEQSGVLRDLPGSDAAKACEIKAESTKRRGLIPGLQRIGNFPALPGVFIYARTDFPGSLESS
jgi:hypothetical protein